jgi:hypothetical protein
VLTETLYAGRLYLNRARAADTIGDAARRRDAAQRAVASERAAGVETSRSRAAQELLKR